MFGVFKKAVKAGAKEVKAEYGANKDFLEAVVAAAAIAANADDTSSDSERSKTVSLLINHKTLGKLYSRDVIEETVKDFFAQAKDASGRNRLARELDDVRGKEGGAQMAEDAYWVAYDICNDDGSIGEKEAAVLSKLANRLGVDVSANEF